MSSMIERVARAMVVEDSGPEGSMLFEIHWKEFGEDYMKTARAAIEAMREPTDEMIGAFHRLTDDNGSVLVTTGYRAMIEAALNHE